MLLRDGSVDESGPQMTLTADSIVGEPCMCAACREGPCSGLFSYDVHISEHGHLGTYCVMKVTGKWGGRVPSMEQWIDNPLTSAGEKEKVSSAQGQRTRLTCGPVLRPPTRSSGALGELPLVGGDWYLHHPRLV